jgi:hypothetical protein
MIANAATSNFERTAGVLMILAVALFLPGGLMFWFRDGPQGAAPPSQLYYAIERGFIAAAVAASALGFVLLAGPFDATASRLLARAAIAVYAGAGILLVAAEALGLSLGHDKVGALIITSVVLAFLSQAALGYAGLQSGLMESWIGWATIGWNLVWLVVLPLVTPRDIYFPVLHHVMPFVIGLALVLRAG